MPRSTTRSARRSADAYDEDQEVRQGGRASRYDDDEDEAPRRSVSRRRSRDEEEERPARSRTTTRSRSRREDSDDEDGRDSRRASRTEGAREAKSTSMGRGREGLRKHRETHKSGNYPEKLRVDDGEEVLIKFVDDDFFITYYEHWIEEFKGEKRQMSFVCLGEDCPLCDIGDEPKFYALINVLDLRKPSKPELKVWYATPNPAGKIEDEMESQEGKRTPKSINDPDLYYIVSKKKERNNFRSYSLKEVKARDLEEDYEVEPLDDTELADLNEDAYTEDIVRINKRSDLQDIADELSE